MLWALFFWVFIYDVSFFCYFETHISFIFDALFVHSKAFIIRISKKNTKTLNVFWIQTEVQWVCDTATHKTEVWKQAFWDQALKEKLVHITLIEHRRTGKDCVDCLRRIVRGVYAPKFGIEKPNGF